MPNNLLPLASLSDEEAAQHAYDKKLLRRLDSNDLITRGAAIQECRRLPVNHIVCLMNALEGKPRQFTPASRRRAGYLMFTLMASALTLLAYSLVTGQALYLLGTIVIFVAFGCWAAIRDTQVKHYSARAENSLAIVIAEIRDPAFLPIAMRILYSHYADTMSGYESETAKALSRTASHLLETLSIEDIKAFGIRQQAFYWFLSPLRWQSNPDAAVRVLQILEVISTTSALPYVQAISETRWRDSLPVRDAARACLAALKEREKEARLPRTLLRASEAPAPSADTLLRPATANADPAPAQLLRPADGGAADALPDSGTLIHENNQTQTFERVQTARIQS